MNKCIDMVLHELFDCKHWVKYLRRVLSVQLERGGDAMTSLSSLLSVQQISLLFARRCLGAEAVGGTRQGWRLGHPPPLCW